METFSALLAICAGNSPVPGEFPTQRPVTRSFDAFFDLRLNKHLSKQWWGWWFETLSRPLWRQRNDTHATIRGDGFEKYIMILMPHLLGTYELNQNHHSWVCNYITKPPVTSLSPGNRRNPSYRRTGISNLIKNYDTFGWNMNTN